MFKVHIVIDEEKVKKDSPNVDIDEIYKRLTQFLLNPEYRMTKVPVEEGIMFKSDDSDMQCAGVFAITTAFSHHKWFREHLKIWNVYDNFGLKALGDDLWHVENYIEGIAML